MPPIQHMTSNNMDSLFSDLQKKARDSHLPEVPSLIPAEKRTPELMQDLSLLEIASINEISDKENSVAEAGVDGGNSSLLPFISDMVGLPIEADLAEIESVLSRYRAVDEDFFSASADHRAAADSSPTLPISAPTQPLSPPSSNFTTASGMSVGGDKKKNEQGVDKECNVETYIIDRIKAEIIETDLDVEWDDIVGLEDVKQIINEIVLWPISRPDIFTGLRRPPKGLLLFGPPGTGKTMIGKCIASQCKATFFSISASSLTSKWVGEGEKMVRALFFLARKMAPSVVFIDEIDSLLSQRTENENEGSRRIKTEFLVQFDGTGVAELDTKHILIIGATNRPQEIDEAARRRLVKRVYVPLPDKASRTAMVSKLISGYKNEIGSSELETISEMTEGYSGSDIYNLCREATLEPLREIEDIKRFRSEDMRPITLADFESACAQIRKSVSQKDLASYASWNESFGSFLRKRR